MSEHRAQTCSIWPSRRAVEPPATFRPATRGPRKPDACCLARDVQQTDSISSGCKTCRSRSGASCVPSRGGGCVLGQDPFTEFAPSGPTVSLADGRHGTCRQSGIATNRRQQHRRQFRNTIGMWAARPPAEPILNVQAPPRARADPPSGPHVPEGVLPGGFRRAMIGPRAPTPWAR